jgi:hypothetical protein
VASQQRGNLVLEKVPTSLIEKRIINYLLKLRQGSSRKAIAEKIKETPAVLFQDISMDRGCMIAGELKALGAVAFFVPYPTEEGPEQGTTPPAPPESPPSVEIKVTTIPKHKKRRKFKLFLLILLLIILTALLAREFFPHPSWLEMFPREKTSSRLPPASDLLPYFSEKARVPSLMEVSSQDLYKTFLQQYRLRPDFRFIKAFESLAVRFGDYRGLQPGLSPFKMGEVFSNGKEIFILLIKDNQTLLKTQLPLPLTFSEVLLALNQWIAAMEKSFPKTKSPTLPEESLKELSAADQEINQLDPRSIIFGLRKLEDIRGRMGPDPKIFRSAARAYALLLLVLTPDPLEYSDHLAVEALIYLALGRWLDPQLPLNQEEALVALNMGYTAHAQGLLQAGSLRSTDPENKKISAFVQKDLTKLKSPEEKGTPLLSSYLLIRLFREMGLEEEAGKKANPFFEEFPFSYSSLVEMVYSGDLEDAKALAFLYPGDIITHLEQGFTTESIKNEKTWPDRIRTFSKNPPSRTLSLTHFESLLDKWTPLGQEGAQGYLIDNQRIKLIFRTLYSGALFLRFNLYFNRLGDMDQTQRYIEELAVKDKNHPLVLRMQAALFSRTAKGKETDSLCTNLISQTNGSGRLVHYAYSKLNDPLARIKLARIAAQKLDGRPEHLFFMGTIFQKLYNLDLAENYFLFGLNQAPFQAPIYINLAQVSGKDDPLSQALTKYPFHFSLQEEAGNYFAQKDETSPKEKALKCYENALNLVPTKTSLYLEKVKVLRQLNRYQEAVSVIKHWLKEFGKQNAATTLFKITLAQTYLDMKKPKLALETIAKEMVTHRAEAMLIGARAYEELRQMKQAEGLYQNISGRFALVDGVLSGTAAFYWRQGRDGEAAALIAAGRKNQDKFSTWYFKEFLDVFIQSTVERIIKAVTPLSKDSQAAWEITILAREFEQRKRPEVAYMLLNEFQPNAFGGRLEHFITIYKVIKNWKGEAEAFKYLRGVVSPQTIMPLTMTLTKHGLFDLVLSELNAPNSFPSGQQEYLWLQRLIAWLVLDKKPAHLETEMINHYQGKWMNRLSSKKESDQFYVLGQFLLGQITRQNLLALIEAPKQRSLFSYYIGLSERLKSNFPEATNWYHLCQETLFQNNEEFLKAGEELFWWAQMGTKNRNRSLGIDREMGAKMELSRSMSFVSTLL